MKFPGRSSGEPDPGEVTRVGASSNFSGLAGRITHLKNRNPANPVSTPAPKLARVMQFRVNAEASDSRWNTVLTPPAGEINEVKKRGPRTILTLDDGTLREGSFTIEELERADEIAFLNSVRGWKPAVLVG